MTITLNGTTGITTPDVTSDGLTVDSTTLVVDEANNRVGVGTSSPNDRLDIGSGRLSASLDTTTPTGGSAYFYKQSTGATVSGYQVILETGSAGSRAEAARIDSSGNLLVGKTAVNGATAGCQLEASGIGGFSVSGNNPLYLNRISNDGVIASIRQDNVQEGSISVSGTTVSYNGGHLARWAQTTTAKDESLLKGTVLSNIDEMNVYVDADGNAVDNEQLNKVKVSDVEGDVNVAGVFVNWDFDEAHNVDEINMAMTGDMIIRIAQGTTVQRGDLLMSAGDGTAKPQGDDIVRSKTIAKVTSINVTCTYADGSYCVPCVLMAC